MEKNKKNMQVKKNTNFLCINCDYACKQNNKVHILHCPKYICLEQISTEEEYVDENTEK